MLRVQALNKVESIDIDINIDSVTDVPVAEPIQDNSAPADVTMPAPVLFPQVTNELLGVNLV